MPFWKRSRISWANKQRASSVWGAVSAPHICGMDERSERKREPIMKTARPNIVFILTDDQGAWAMGCAGNGDIETPNLDRIAERGVRFDNFFCASPVCSPARASILTGRIPSAHGVQDWIRSGNLDRDALGDKKNDPYYVSEEKPIPYLDGMLCYTDVLKEQGYHCALAGKWHLGDSMNPQHGFEKWFTIGRGGCYYKKADIVENGTLTYESRYITNVITDKALDYLEEYAGQEEPFYLSVHYTAPHDPWDEDQHPAEFVEKYRDCAFTATPDLPIHPNQIPTAPYGVGEERKRLLRGYYAAISAMDADVGRLLDALEEKGISENTIVIFMADNGMNMGHHGIWGKGNGTFPFNMYDTAVKVPLLVSWPGHYPEKLVSRRMCSQYDYFQTLMDMVEIDAKLPESLPGRSFADVFRMSGENGADSGEDHSVVIYDEYGPTRMIRTEEWKLIRRYPYGPDELYHLSVDPEETVNLIQEEAYQKLADSLSGQLNQWFYRYADPAMDGAREGVTGYGQLCRPGIYADRREPFYHQKS